MIAAMPVSSPDTHLRNSVKSVELSRLFALLITNIDVNAAERKKKKKKHTP
jgi:hypothetical protein